MKNKKLELFRAYVANWQMKSAYTEKDIEDILVLAHMLSDPEVYSRVETIKTGNNLALYIVQKDFGGFRTIYFSPKKGVYKGYCPNCIGEIIEFKRKTINSSLGKCGKCRNTWVVSWFAGMSIIMKLN